MYFMIIKIIVWIMIIALIVTTIGIIGVNNQ